MHNFLTNRGHALKVLFARLGLAADKTLDGWGESEEKKPVISTEADNPLWTC